MNRILSIIVPSYNMEAYLPKCLESLIIDDKGLLQKLDVIVVNDGSKDRTSEIAHEFEAKYPGVFRVVDKSNGHYGSCINCALKVACGVFVRVLDADDSFNAKELLRFVRFLCDSEVRDEKLDAIISAYEKVDANCNTTWVWRCGLDSQKVLDFASIVALDERIQMHALTYRLSGIRNIRYCQTEGICYTDTEWCFAPMARVNRFRYFDGSVYRYFIGRENQSVSRDAVCRNYWMYERLLSSLCSSYCQIVCDEAHRFYLEISIKEVIAIMFYYTIWLLPLCNMRCRLYEINITVRKIPSLLTVSDHRSYKRRFNWRLALWMIAHENISFVIMLVARKIRDVKSRLDTSM